MFREKTFAVKILVSANRRRTALLYRYLLYGNATFNFTLAHKSYQRVVHTVCYRFVWRFQSLFRLWKMNILVMGMNIKKVP